jgi:hypothetical protein
MLLEGDELRRQVELASRDGFETRRSHALLRFHAPAIGTNGIHDRFKHLSRTEQMLQRTGTDD